MRRYRLARQTPKWHGGIVKWWQRQISVKVDVKGRRDHLALERTFLGYIRTSLAFSMLGVLITQLFRLQHTYFPDETFGFYVVGIPLGTIFIFAAIVIVLIGAFRFWRQQSAMGRGKVWAGGWEINTIMVGSILVSTGLFAVFLRF
ncbi:hypothetical protein EJ08DRAFT_597951 [Tothia fuscella]|uniref:DUF202 domain-containing protein n=1 Tax=Tothia fuscella TaxID=1048955 RepID=A0A9P4NGU7_9PEZI|nr:hypothetical protein EJ08DRAFT_597951 [Tothia fuscella]